MVHPLREDGIAVERRQSSDIPHLAVKTMTFATDK
jgi:hypothetical protein